MNFTEEELEEILKNKDVTVAKQPVIRKDAIASKDVLPFKKHKYNAKRTDYNGTSYPSKKEAMFACELDNQKERGEVSFWVSQVNLVLPGGVKYRVDFLVFYPDGKAKWFEVKGMDLPVGKLKRKIAESVYPIKIEVV